MTTAEALAYIAAVRQDADGNLAELLDLIASEVRRTDDPTGVAAHCRQLFRQEVQA